jgi:hypothetical protein
MLMVSASQGPQSSSRESLIATQDICTALKISPGGFVCSAQTFDTTASATWCNTGRDSEKKLASECGFCDHLHVPATPYFSSPPTRIVCGWRGSGKPDILTGTSGSE